jgi:hypothetical protein
MSKELGAFVQILLADECRICQNNNLQASEIISVIGPKFPALKYRDSVGLKAPVLSSVDLA